MMNSLIILIMLETISFILLDHWETKRPKKASSNEAQFTIGARKHQLERNF